MWIFVKSSIPINNNVDNERKRIDNLQPHDKVEDVRVLIAQALGFKPSKIKVFHKGKTLEDGKKLEEYNIKQDETLQVFPLSMAGSRSASPPASRSGIDAMETSPSRRPISLMTPSPPCPLPVRGTPPTLTLTVPPLASDDDSDDEAPDIIPGTRTFSPQAVQYSGLRDTDYDPEERTILESLGNSVCDECIQWPRRPCKRCGCYVCGGKDNPHRTLVCDKCENYYHCECLDPPMRQLPEDEWYCPKCDDEESSGIEEAVEEEEGTRIETTVEPKVEAPPEKKPGRPRKTSNKTNTNSVVSKMKTCTIVDPHHFGPIPGIEVGQTWKFRKQCSESGVHRPPMAGISGTPKTGSQSIVISGGYKDDVDNGETFIYSGSGGRESNEKGSRIATGQSFAQTLTKSNAALAITMFPNMTDPEKLDPNGAVADDWRQSKPVRVVRSDKNKNSKYAPAEGNRYDGLYKLVRYWPETGKDGYLVYRYEFQRDDPTPAPWTDEGKARIQALGLKIIYPEDWDSEMKKAQGNITVGGTIGKRKRESTVTSTASNSSKKNKSPYNLPENLVSLIKTDTKNTELWAKAHEKSTCVGTFIAAFVELLSCPVCEDFVNKPVTTNCGHNVCLSCLQHSIHKHGLKCPKCWEFLVGGDDEHNRKQNLNQLGGLKINEELIAVLRYFGSEYSKEKDQ